MADIVEDITVAGPGHPQYAGAGKPATVLSRVVHAEGSQVHTQRRIDAIHMRFRDLDRITGHRRDEATYENSEDAFVKDAVAEKKRLRTELRALGAA